MAQAKPLRISLLLRLGVFIVTLFWALDEIVQPRHAAQVFASFYFYFFPPPLSHN